MLRLEKCNNLSRIKKTRAQKLHLSLNSTRNSSPEITRENYVLCDHVEHVCPISIETFKEISFTRFPNFIIHHWWLGHNKIFYSLEVARWSHALDGPQLVSRLIFWGGWGGQLCQKTISQVYEMKIHLTRGSRRPNLFILLFPLLFQDSIAENIRVSLIITFIYAAQAK